MVEGITVEGRVGGHEGSIVLLPERPMVAPANARDPPKRGAGLKRQVRSPPERNGRTLHHPAGAEVADEAQEVAPVRVEPAEQRRVVLATGSLVVIAQHLERDHERDPLVPGPCRLGVDGAAHVLGETERRLLVGEGDKPDRAFWLKLDEHPRQLEQPGYATG